MAAGDDNVATHESLLMTTHAALYSSTVPLYRTSIGRRSGGAPPANCDNHAQRRRKWTKAASALPHSCEIGHLAYSARAYT
jgi:hypothetical protein